MDGARVNGNMYENTTFGKQTVENVEKINIFIDIFPICVLRCSLFFRAKRCRLLKSTRIGNRNEIFKIPFYPFTPSVYIIMYKYAESSTRKNTESIYIIIYQYSDRFRVL